MAYLKRIFTITKSTFSQRCKDGSVNVINHIHWLRDRNYMITSKDARKPLVKSQHVFLIKKPSL